jgi:hypothetical protein
MTCADFEVLLCDYVDGTLDPSSKLAFEEHRSSCKACASLAQDVTGTLSFLERVEQVEPPSELLTRIAFSIPREEVKAKGWRGWFGSLLRGRLHPILQPKIAMGMAMTILSFSMLGRFAGIEPRQLKPSDLHPAAIWAAADDRLHRSWARALKYYENLRLVYEVRTRLQEWSEQNEADNGANSTDSNETQSRGSK